jgi:hypothetical protein
VEQGRSKISVRDCDNELNQISASIFKTEPKKLAGRMSLIVFLVLSLSLSLFLSLSFFSYVSFFFLQADSFLTFFNSLEVETNILIF